MEDAGWSFEYTGKRLIPKSLSITVLDQESLMSGGDVGAMISEFSNQFLEMNAQVTTHALCFIEADPGSDLSSKPFDTQKEHQTPKAPPIATKSVAKDVPRYTTGVFIEKNNGLVCWVHLKGNGRYELWDEYGKTTLVTPAADGSFQAFGGIPGKFEANGEVTWPNNRWLSHKQADTEAFSLFYNLGRRTEPCLIRSHPDGLEMVDEHGNRAIARFSPSSRQFTIWGIVGEVLPGDTIKWPGGFWRR
jgi:hypothetical protein